MFLNDDGKGNVRMYYVVDGTTKTYKDNTAGTIDYKTGQVILTSLILLRFLMWMVQLQQKLD